MVMTNPAFDRLLGYKADEVAGRTSLDMVAPECRTSIAAMIDLQYEKNETMNYCATYLRADGSKQAVRVTSAIVTMEDAKQFRILTVLPDTAVAKTMRRETAGRINLVGLDDVRAALGDRWQARAERVMATAEAIIKRRCGVEDSFSRADDTSFLICFGSLNETEAAFRAAMIGREIRDRLIGQGDDPDNAFVRSIAATVRLPDGEIGSAADSRGFLLDGLDKELGRVEQAARETLQAAWASADCELEPVLGLGQTDTIANHVRLPDELQRRLASAQAALPRKESEAFDLDALLLGLAARQAIGDMAKGLSMPLMVNVRFDVFLTRRATERYFATCLKIDQRVGTRLILMLSALPQGLPKARLLDCVTRLRPFCRAVGYRIDSLADLAIIELSNSSIRSWRCPRRRCPARRRTSAGPRSTRSMPGGRGFWSMALNRRGQPPACGRLAPI
jgi:PAS domain S-box-containing protein